MTGCEAASTDGEDDHQDGTDTCHGPVQEVDGLAVWLAGRNGDVSCHVDGNAGLDRAGVSALISALSERLALMPA